MRVARWGNSLGIRLPVAVVEALGLVEGDEIVIRVEGEREFVVTRKPDQEALFERLRALRGSLPEDFVFDRSEANER